MLQAKAEADPPRFRRRVALVARLGRFGAWIIYAAWPTLFALAVLVMLWLDNVWFAAAFLGYILLSMLFDSWRNRVRPNLVKLRRSQAPRLFEMVDEIRAALGGVVVHEVVIDETLNALAGVGRRQLWVVGRWRRRLVLGLPVMYMLTPRQLRSVIAHEIAHFARGDIYVLINHAAFYWSALAEAAEHGRTKFWRITRPYYQRIACHIGAHAAVFARLAEIEADRTEVEMFGAQPAADGLIAMALADKLLHKRIIERMYHPDEMTSATPPDDLMERIAEALDEGMPAGEAHEALTTLLKPVTGTDDSHPALAERIERMGLSVDAWLAAPAEQAMRSPLIARRADSAAVHLLHESLPEVSRQLSATWARHIAKEWARRYHDMHDESSAHRRVEMLARQPGASFELRCLAATSACGFQGPEYAEPLIRQLVEERPESADAHYMLGRLLLDRQDAACVEHLAKAGRLNPLIMPEVLELLYHFEVQRGDLAEGELWRHQYDDAVERVFAAIQERSASPEKGAIEPHDLPADRVESMRVPLSGHPQVQRAFLVKRRLRHLPEIPQYLLVVERKLRAIELSTERRDQQLAFDLAEQLPLWSDTGLFIAGGNKRMARRCRRVKGALIVDNRKRRRAPAAANPEPAV